MSRTASDIVNSANSKFSSHDYEGALAEYDSALEMLKAPEIYSNRGATLRQLGRNEDALDSFDMAIAMRPEFPDPHFNKALLLQSLGRLEEAVASYDAALAHRPELVNAQVEKCNILNMMEKWDEAIAAAQAILESHPDSLPAITELAYAYVKSNQPQAAVDTLESVLQGDQLESVTLRMTQIYAVATSQLAAEQYSAGEFDSAAEMYGRAIAAESTPGRKFNRAVCYHGAGRTSDAVAALEEVLKDDPANGRALILIGTIKTLEEDFESGLEWLSKAVDTEHGNAQSQAHYNRGVCALKTNQPDIAKEAFEGALALDAELESAQTGLTLAEEELRLRAFLESKVDNGGATPEAVEAVDATEEDEAEAGVQPRHHRAASIQEIQPTPDVGSVPVPSARAPDDMSRARSASVQRIPAGRVSSLRAMWQQRCGIAE